MASVWVKFAEDTSLPEHLDAAGKKQLSDMFDPRNPASHWSRALHAVELRADVPPDGTISWDGDTPLINWSYMTALVSGGATVLRQDEQGTQTHSTSYTPRHIWTMIKSQWAITRYVLARTEGDVSLPENKDEQIIESLALGICLLGLTQRLNIPDEKTMAAALAQPEDLPARSQKTIRQIAAIQKRRTALSKAWQVYFPQTDNKMREDSVPISTSTQTEWRGIGVCGDEVVGQAVFVSVPSALAGKHDGATPLIAVFARARPKTIEVFPDVVGVIYGDGGALSHACTIARETNLPCVTGLGQACVATLRAQNKVWIRIDPSKGTVQVISDQ